jgi:hypothetical protein
MQMHVHDRQTLSVHQYAGLIRRAATPGKKRHNAGNQCCSFAESSDHQETFTTIHQCHPLLTGERNMIFKAKV